MTSQQTRVDTEADLGKVRAPIDEDKLADYICTSCPSYFARPFTIKQFGFGQSNPSYQITDGQGRKCVLRKQPPGALVSKSAHRVDREYYVLKALSEYPDIRVPVPKVIHLCTDRSVIGTDFYIMEFVPGRIFHDPAFPSLNATDRRDCWRSAIKSLTTLHSVDVKKLDLPDSFKKLSGSHYPRQLSTLAKVTESQAKVRNQSTNKPISMIPKFYEITQWMKQNMPPLEQSTMVHGDYKIDNLIYHPTENRVVAILDWELCTTGHPLADLGNLLQPYSFPSIPTSELKIGGLSLAKKLDGLPTLKENLADYKSLCNWDPAKYWTFAVVYAHLRLAVIVHGIKARHARDQASSAHAGDYAKLVPVMASLAWKEIENSKKCEHKL